MNSNEDAWLSELTSANFLTLYELVLDIHSELQLGQVPRLKILPASIRFQQLFPADTIPMRDQYCRLRWMAADLLKQKGIVRGFQQIQRGHRWQNVLEFDVDQNRIVSLVSAMNSEYRRRTPSPEPAAQPTAVSADGPDLPDKVTLLWLTRHVPLTGWIWFIGLLIAATLLGTRVGQTSLIREMLGGEPQQVPTLSGGDLRQRVDNLIEGHNANTARITAGIVDEERAAASTTLTSGRRPHLDAAQRLRETLQSEHERFQVSLAALRGFSQ